MLLLFFSYLCQGVHTTLSLPFSIFFIIIIGMHHLQRIFHFLLLKTSDSNADNVKSLITEYVCLITGLVRNNKKKRQFRFYREDMGINIVLLGVHWASEWLRRLHSFCCERDKQTSFDVQNTHNNFNSTHSTLYVSYILYVQDLPEIMAYTSWGDSLDQNNRKVPSMKFRCMRSFGDRGAQRYVNIVTKGVILWHIMA